MPHALSPPASSSPPSTSALLVLVTGANGFIASHTIHQLLENGYRVLGTVRDESKAQSVLKTHSALTPDLIKNLEVAIVSDITAPDAYNDLFAEHKPSAVLHMASPFAYNTTEFEATLLRPAVRGTEAIFSAAAKAPSVRRIVHTNSFACIYDASLGLRPGYTYTARDWCPLAYEDGVRASSPQIAYRASKAVAERSAWGAVGSQQNIVTGAGRACGYDLISLCPAMVFGPYLPTLHSMPASIEELNTSNKLIWDVVSAGKDGQVPPTRGPVWIDVRDVAEAHVRSISLDLTVHQNPRTGMSDGKRQRFLLAKGVYCSQEIADVSRSALQVGSEGQEPHAPAHRSSYLERIPVGKPGAREAQSHFGVDASVEEKLLTGKQGGWRDLSETLSELIPQLFQIEAHGTK
ncbi:hypothetical protein H2204_005548 [Knufia peltigerae]|uniref:NAD-dependent epimerase/dehydratase domain-containing protein n=1 Tax=Knufia peltigerae TaxID=1002370 RepID=A0AA39CYP1_9EURO|nr:hypothetical protein H2204_005548 [Knufia peltigerae]